MDHAWIDDRDPAPHLTAALEPVANPVAIRLSGNVKLCSLWEISDGQAVMSTELPAQLLMSTDNR